MPLTVPVYPYAAQRVFITTSYVIAPGDFEIYCNHSSAINITLPSPATPRDFKIIDISGAIETNNVTLVRHGSENINNLAASRILQSNFGIWVVSADGTNWWL